MKTSLAVLLGLVSLLAFIPLAQAVSTTTTSAAAPSGGAFSGYVVYNVQVVMNGTTRAASVNETVTSSSHPGESIITLMVTGAVSNFTYSRFVNSSSILLPYMPGISNESYTYSNSSYTVTASISQHGASQASFQGKTYPLTDYAFSAVITSANGTNTVTGSISTLPSDLVYSVVAQSQTSSVSATLKATSLPLSADPAAPSVQAASAGVGLSLAAGAVVLSLGVKFKSKQQSQGPKPDHWVD